MTRCTTSWTPEPAAGRWREASSTTGRVPGRLCGDEDDEGSPQRRPTRASAVLRHHRRGPPGTGRSQRGSGRDDRGLLTIPPHSRLLPGTRAVPQRRPRLTRCNLRLQGLTPGHTTGEAAVPRPVTRQTESEAHGVRSCRKLLQPHDPGLSTRRPQPQGLPHTVTGPVSRTSRPDATALKV